MRRHGGRRRRVPERRTRERRLRALLSSTGRPLRIPGLRRRAIERSARSRPPHGSDGSVSARHAGSDRSSRASRSGRWAGSEWTSRSLVATTAERRGHEHRRGLERPGLRLSTVTRTVAPDETERVRPVGSDAIAQDTRIPADQRRWPERSTGRVSEALGIGWRAREDRSWRTVDRPPSLGSDGIAHRAPDGGYVMTDRAGASTTGESRRSRSRGGRATDLGWCSRPRGRGRSRSCRSTRELAVVVESDAYATPTISPRRREDRRGVARGNTEGGRDAISP
jgi:hypothetical protein